MAAANPSQSDARGRAVSDRAQTLLELGPVPRVAGPARSLTMPFAIVCAVVLGGVVFFTLSDQRAREAFAQAPSPPIALQAAPAPPPQPLAPQPAPRVSPEPAPQASAQASQSERAQRLAAQAMIFDQSQPGPDTAPRPSGASDNAAPNRDDAFGQGSNELFASQLERDASQARARAPGDLSNVVPEGAVIPAVLETALNSDLPGYTRAVVSRDVLSFDGTKVLVPRGSRLIGQYRSAVALGQSRAFVIWTRLVRPDGVSVQIADPGADALGRGGLQGRVNTHFGRRFGGAVLLTLLNAAANAVASDHDTQVVIANTSDLGNAALGQTTNVAPTVDIAQGTPIRIFVTRDLDFSGVDASP